MSWNGHDTNTRKGITGVLLELGYLEHFSFGEAVYKFQEFHGLDRTGQWTEIESNAVRSRFCRCPDYETASDNRHGHWEATELSLFHDIAAFKGNGGDDDWFLSGARWFSEVCGLDFHLVDTKAESDIFAHWRRIDTASNVLAWSMLPEPHLRRGQRKLEQRYDSADARSYRSRKFAEKVIAHEIGHAIGFPHSRDRRDLMFPSILNSEKYVGPGNTATAIRLYGKRTDGPGPTPEPEDECTDWWFAGIES